MNPGGIAAIALLVVALGLRFGIPAIRAKLRERAAARQVSQWQAEFAAANPPGPPLSADETVALHQFVKSLALPAVVLAPNPAGLVAAGGSRLGGPVWLAADAEWPRARSGAAMEFLGQLDFADLPPLPDFPSSGVLQFFIASDDLFGLDYENPAASDFALRWHETVGGDGQLVEPAPLDDQADCTPWMDARARREGIALSGTPATQIPQYDDWRIMARTEGMANREGIDALGDWITEHPMAPAMAHHVGGQTVWVQNDFREATLRTHDRCLLRLTSDKLLLWGDVGEASFTIAAADLRARAWDRAAFSWDCS